VSEASSVSLPFTTPLWYICLTHTAVPKRGELLQLQTCLQFTNRHSAIPSPVLPKSHSTFPPIWPHTTHFHPPNQPQTSPHSLTPATPISYSPGLKLAFTNHNPKSVEFCRKVSNCIPPTRSHSPTCVQFCSEMFSLPQGLQPTTIEKNVAFRRKVPHAAAPTESPFRISSLGFHSDFEFRTFAFPRYRGAYSMSYFISNCGPIIRTVIFPISSAPTLAVALPQAIANCSSCSSA